MAADSVAGDQFAGAQAAVNRSGAIYLVRADALHRHGDAAAAEVRCTSTSHSSAQKAVMKRQTNSETDAEIVSMKGHARRRAERREKRSTAQMKRSFCAILGCNLNSLPGVSSRSPPTPPGRHQIQRKTLSNHIRERNATRRALSRQGKMTLYHIKDDEHKSETMKRLNETQSAQRPRKWQMKGAHKKATRRGSGRDG